MKGVESRILQQEREPHSEGCQGVSDMQGKFTISVLGLVIGCCVASGCAQFDLKERIPWVPGKDGKIGQPARMAVVWTDAIKHQAGMPSQRGFGGKIIFYPPRKDEPIQVEGRLEVYAFNEAGRDPGNARPDRKYVFTKDQFTELLNESEEGDSYSVWIPWDVVGGEQTKISLITRFIPTEGALVMSEQISHMLPGRIPQAELQKMRQQVSAHEHVQPVAFEQDVPAQQAAAPNPSAALEQARSKTSSLRTTTIPLRSNTLPQAVARNRMRVSLPGYGRSPSVARTLMEQRTLPEQAPAPSATSVRREPMKFRAAGAPISVPNRGRVGY